jgi:FkbH-like protein
LTTKRYTENDISHFVNSKTHHVFVFSLTDKYGDYGITGEAIIESKDKIAFIDTFLMSCRVIGRNVEKRFFQELIPYLKEKGIEKIKASFLSTPKNHQVKNFYDEFGFQIESTNGDDTNYVILIDDFKSININYIKVTYEG